MTGVLMSSCRHCGFVHFPRRLACPRCHDSDLATTLARRGVVEQATLSGEQVIAAVRSELGPTVVAAFARGARAVRPGDTVDLSGSPNTVSRETVAYVPDAASGPAPIAPLPPEQRTLPVLLEHQAQVYGDKTLLRVGAIERSFREVRDVVAAVAGMLCRAGVRAGDRVATLSGNRLELLDVILGCTWMGAVAVPLNVAVRGEALRHALTNSGAKILVLDPNLLDVLDRLDTPDSLEEVWLMSGAATEPARPRPYVVRPLPDPVEPVPAAELSPGDTAAILYTSGTTGISKGVCCAHAQFHWWGVNVGEALGIGPDDVVYTVLPLFHTNALTAFVQALVAGATFVLGTRFSASRFWTDAASVDATVTYLLGAMVNILCGREPTKHDSAHRLRIALAPATPAALHDAFQRRFGVTLVEGYGSTETNMVIGAPANQQRPGYMGRVLPGFDALVVDEHDQPVPDGAPGELVLRHREPYSCATGYFAMPDKTVEAWRNLWFHTGDRVVRESDGWFRFLDRTKDAIRRRGENISSFEVEQAIGQHPAVENVAVYAVPSEFAEDEVMAALVLRPGCSLAPQDLVTFLEPRLARFAIPRFVRFVPDLPTTENGKVRKAELRDAGVTVDSWDRDKEMPR
jgi:crotonobetaine/carnitine-CoA ligase